MAEDCLKYVDLEEASEIMGKSLTYIRLCVKEKKLTAYVLTPSSFPHSAYAFGNTDSEIFEPLSGRLASCYKEPLASYCRIKPPLIWDDGQVRCDTIVVTGVDDKGLIIDDNCMTLAEADGYIGLNGEIYWKRGWSFKEKEIMLRKEDVRSWADQHGQAVSDPEQSPDLIKAPDAENTVNLSEKERELLRIANEKKNGLKRRDTMSAGAIARLFRSRRSSIMYDDKGVERRGFKESTLQKDLLRLLKSSK